MDSDMLAVIPYEVLKGGVTVGLSVDMVKFEFKALI